MLSIFKNEILCLFGFENIFDRTNVYLKILNILNLFSMF